MRKRRIAKSFQIWRQIKGIKRIKVNLGHRYITAKNSIFWWNLHLNSSFLAKVDIKNVRKSTVKLSFENKSFENLMIKNSRVPTVTHNCTYDIFATKWDKKIKTVPESWNSDIEMYMLFPLYVLSELILVFIDQFVSIIYFSICIISSTLIFYIQLIKLFWCTAFCLREKHETSSASRRLDSVCPFIFMPYCSMFSFL